MGWLRDVVNRFGRAPARPAEAAAPPADVDGDPSAWKARGNAAVQAGDLAEARRCYERALAAQSDDAALLLNLGFVLLEQGQHQAAAERLQQSLSAPTPGEFAHEAQFLLGRALAAQGRVDAALAAFAAASRARPDFIQPLHASVILLRQQGRHAEAVVPARQMAQLQPTAAHRILLAETLALAGSLPEAAAVLDALCAQEPRNLEAALQQFSVCLRLGNHDAALASAERALAVTGPNAAALVNVAVALEGLGRLEASLVRLEEALRIDPKRRDALVNRIQVLQGLGRVEESAAAARAALAFYPDDADIHWNLSISHLLLGEFEQGWAEQAWRSIAFRAKAPAFGFPRWQGEDLGGRSLFVYGEQGFGDTVQFARYLPEVARRAATVYLAVPAPLEPLMRELPANCRLLPTGSRLPAADFECSLMSLPAVLGTRLQTIPANVPYMATDPALVQAWRDRLPKDALNVGIAWSGKPTHVNDRNRSMTLETFRRVAVPGCRFVTLQPDLRPADRATLSAWPAVLDLGRELRHFGDSAALVQALDLVISVDTSVAHLAGALAKPAWILLPFAPDWRWMLEREDSPWYPTARLFRQAAGEGWEPVLDRVRAALAGLAATGARPAQSG